MIARSFYHSRAPQATAQVLRQHSLLALAQNRVPDEHDKWQDRLKSYLYSYSPLPLHIHLHLPLRRSNPVAAKLLSYISYIKHKAIPRRLLPKASSVEQIIHALGTLRAYAFMNLDKVSERYDLHRLVYLAARI